MVGAILLLQYVMSILRHKTNAPWRWVIRKNDTGRGHRRKTAPRGQLVKTHGRKHTLSTIISELSCDDRNLYYCAW